MRFNGVHNLYSTMPDEVIVTAFVGIPLSVPVASISLTISIPSTTLPNTTCLPSSCNFPRDVNYPGDMRNEETHPRSFHGGDEELRSIGVAPSVRHGEQTRGGMFEVEVLI
jgi:hypothetical protein